MELKTVQLFENRPWVKLCAYISNIPNRRDAMLVLPGGGYENICSDREGYPIAEAFQAQGFNCFVLDYSVGKNAKFPTPLEDASFAMKYIREHADELHVNFNRVFCVGFSAGGHLCGLLGTLWHTVKSVPYGINRPTGMILCYPVTTGKRGIGHAGSFAMLCGVENPADEQLAALSLENLVDERTSPAFIMHTADDGLVNVEGSFYFAEALSRAKVPLEMRIYHHAAHGVALGNAITANNFAEFDNPAIARWVSDAAEWASQMK